MCSRYKSQNRSYCDKAVQTELPPAPALSKTGFSGSLQPSLAVRPSGIAELAISELLSMSGNAYNQTKLSEKSDLPLPSMTGKIWLDYNRPSCAPHDVQRRVVSLPDSAEITKSHVDEKPRVVSMPEQICRGHRAVVPKREIEDSRRQSTHSRGYPSDLPRTPSPPSSPDSVLTTSNETHVPGVVLHQREDENGWITWANSPPRPIPALHGPSSLPYARCPSGAEGTIVEGDNLAHKVWGLGSDNAHSNPRPKSPQSPRLAKCPTNSVSLPFDDLIDYQLVTSSAMARHRDIVIDLSKPSCYSEAQEGRVAAFDGASLHSPLHMCPRSSSVKSYLNSSAPAFDPANQGPDFDLARTGSQKAVGLTDFYLHGARDIAAAYQHYTYDLTPPSSASPRWSPVFQPPHTAGIDNYDPWIYSPQADFESYTNRFMGRQVTNRDLLTMHNTFLAEHAAKSNIEATHTQRYLAPRVRDVTNALMNNHKPPSHKVDNHALAHQNRFSECPERYRNVSHQQTRSIPLARLIQRRLSSVAEDTSGHIHHMTGRTKADVKQVSSNLTGKDFTEISPRIEIRPCPSPSTLSDKMKMHGQEDTGDL